MPNPDEKYQRDDSGNVIDPPIIAAYEERLRDAQAAANIALVIQVSEEYADAQRELADAHDRAVDGDTEDTTPDTAPDTTDEDTADTGDVGGADNPAEPTEPATPTPAEPAPAPAT